MVSNKQGWCMRLLVALLVLHTSHCQEGNKEPSCRLDRESFHCSNVKSFAFITPLLPTYRPGIYEFTLEDSSDVQLTSTDFHHTAFLSTWKVELRRCNISTINPEPFTSLPRLMYLSFQSNNLTEISSSSFLGLEGLETVDLHDNQIASVAADTFKNLHNLIKVYLSNNKISSIADSMFENQRKLTYLYLAQNKITVVNDKTFKGLVQLGYLDLRYNWIESISPGAFAELSELRELYLGYNKLQSLPPALFQTYTRIEVLDLSGNNLANLANYPLNIPSLHQVFLNDGKIQSIPADYFANLKNMFTLSLSSNELSRFEDVLLEGMPRLHELHLDANKFTSFNLTAFRELNPIFVANVANFGAFSLENNPWNCSEPVREDMINLCKGENIIF